LGNVVKLQGKTTGPFEEEKTLVHVVYWNSCGKAKPVSLSVTAIGARHRLVDIRTSMRKG